MYGVNAAIVKGARRFGLDPTCGQFRLRREPCRACRDAFSDRQHEVGARWIRRWQDHRPMLRRSKIGCRLVVVQSVGWFNMSPSEGDIHASFKRPVTSVSLKVSAKSYPGTSVLEYLSKGGGSHRSLGALAPIILSAIFAIRYVPTLLFSAWRAWENPHS